MKNVLWIADACCDSGFSKVTHNIINRLDHRTGGPFNCSVLGINYLGNPHPEFLPDVYPCWPGGDMFGIGRLEDVVPKVRPDVIVIMNDPWNISDYMEVLQFAAIPVVGALAINGKNCQSGTKSAKSIKGRGLNTLSHAIFWNEFAKYEAETGGYEGHSTVIPLGVDTEIFQPRDQSWARKECGIPIDDNAFLVGNINRNQPRKHFDLTLSYFAEWAFTRGHDDAFLFLHAAPTGERSLDIKQWITYLERCFPGTKKKVMVSQPEAYKGLDERTLALLMNCMDGLMSTSDGEGMGLPALEAMASGIFVAVPDWAAYSDWAAEGARLVRCSTQLASSSGTNVLGAIPDRDDFLVALDEMYDVNKRGAQAEKGLRCARSAKFNWDTIAAQYVKVLTDITAIPTRAISAVGEGA